MLKKEFNKCIVSCSKKSNIESCIGKSRVIMFSNSKKFKKRVNFTCICKSEVSIIDDVQHLSPDITEKMLKFIQIHLH